MSLASTYRVQDGCANCRHVFVRQEHEGNDELYCTLGAPERPPCMSFFMNECELVEGQPWGADHEGHRKWDEWKDNRSVVPQGICAEWLLKNESMPYMTPTRIDQATEHAVRRFLSLIGERYSIAEAILFGSRARGTHHPDSDTDVAIVLSGTQQHLMPTILDMADTAFDVLLETEILISPLPVWLDEWEHPETYSNPELLRNIDREGIRL